MIQSVFFIKKQKHEEEILAYVHVFHAASISRSPRHLVNGTASPQQATQNIFDLFLCLDGETHSKTEENRRCTLANAGCLHWCALVLGSLDRCPAKRPVVPALQLILLAFTIDVHYLEKKKIDPSVRTNRASNISAKSVKSAAESTHQIC